MFFIVTNIFSQEISIEKMNKNTLLFKFENNTENSIEIPKLIWRTYSPKKNKSSGLISDNYYTLKRDTLILDLERSAPKYFKGSINGKETNNDILFLDITLKPNEKNQQEIKIKKNILQKCNYIQLLYNKINYITPCW